MEENGIGNELSSVTNSSELGPFKFHHEGHHDLSTGELKHSIIEAISKVQVEPNGSVTRSVVAVDVMSMKDEQIRILTDQNHSLMIAIKSVQSELDACIQSKFSMDERYQIIEDQNFELASKLRFVENESIKAKEDLLTAREQLNAIAKRNEELLRQLEAEKVSNARISTQVIILSDEVNNLQSRYGNLIESGKSQEDLAKEAIKNDEIIHTEMRKLRDEIDLSKKESQAFKVKAALELESLEEQLRIRKEKQYHLIEKMQLQEESRREAEDRAATLKRALSEIKIKNHELETQAQLESNKYASLEEANKALQSEMRVTVEENKALLTKLHELKQEKLRIEAEARDDGEKLREMAEKVFQLLEKLKLSDHAKDIALKSLKAKGQDFLVMQKKMAALQKKATEEEKSRAQTLLENSELEEQIRSIKKSNTQLSNKCKEEAKLRAQEEEQKKAFEEKARILDSRLSFLLNKLQSDEENKLVQKDEVKKMEEQLAETTKQYDLYEQKVQELKESNRILSNQLLEKVEEAKSLNIKLDAMRSIEDKKEKDLDEQQQGQEESKRRNDPTRDFAEGRLRFYIHCNTATGGFIIKGKCQKDRDWIEQHGCNQMLRKALKLPNVKEALMKHFAELCGMWMMQEEQCFKLTEELQEQRKKLEMVEHSYDDLQAKFWCAEENKRRMLLRYISSVKRLVSSGDRVSQREQNEVGQMGTGKIILPESDLKDEDVHAIVALIRNNVDICDLNLRDNHITDEGAHVIASMMVGKSGLQNIDLRGNNISQSGIKAFAEALGRSRSVNEICIHAGGKIEVFGKRVEKTDIAQNQQEVQRVGDVKEIIERQTICIIDIRENHPEALLNNISYDGIEPIP
jgi:hypothetical protein